MLVLGVLSLQYIFIVVTQLERDRCDYSLSLLHDQSQVQIGYAVPAFAASSSGLDHPRLTTLTRDLHENDAQVRTCIFKLLQTPDGGIEAVHCYRSLHLPVRAGKYNDFLNDPLQILCLTMLTIESSIELLRWTATGS